MNGIKYRSADEMKDSGIEWLGEIPREWQSKRLKFLAQCFPSNVDKKSNENEPAVKLCNYTDAYKNDFITANMSFMDATASKSQIVRYGLRQGDIVITKDSESPDDIGIPAYVLESIDRLVCGYHLSIIRTFHIQYSLFFYYHLRSTGIRKYFETRANGITRYALGSDDFNQLFLSVPSYFEQRKIANFLDIKTAQFDSIIAKKEHLIAKLEESKKSLISEVVTGKVKIVDGQLVPRQLEEMKDSGVEWLGMVPGNWIVGGLTKYIGPIIDYRGKTPEKVDDGVFLVTAKNIKGGKIDYTLSEEYVRSDQYKLIMQRGAPIIGDVLFTTEAPLGEVANIDRTDIALAQRIIKFRGIECLLDNYFLRYFIMGECFQNQIQSRATGSTALGIKASKLPDLKILIPTIEEQNEICRFLNKKIEYISNCIEKYLQQVTLLKSAKQSLISEAVTGKIDLRDWVIIEQGGAS